jgi:glycerol-3-phosphate dehydrogenase
MSFQLRARTLVNACGPWADAQPMLGIETRYRHLFSKGIHLIVDRVTDSRRVLTFLRQRRPPVLPDSHGSEDLHRHHGHAGEDPEVGVTDEDRQFVLDNVNALLDLREPIRPRM